MVTPVRESDPQAGVRCGLQCITRSKRGEGSREANTAHRRTQITIQTDRTLIVRRSRSRARLRCAECGCEVEVVDLAEAEALTGMSQTRISDGAGANRWHCLQGEGDAVLVCLDSLLKAM